jgi:hypothetical protein
MSLWPDRPEIDLWEFLKMGAKLAIRYEQVLEHMLAGRSVTAIAALMNVSRETIYNWIATDVFKDLHEAAKAQIFDACVSSFTAGGLEAIALMRAAVNDCRLPPEDRISAATYLCEVALKFIGARDDKAAKDVARPFSELTKAEQIQRLQAEQKAEQKALANLTRVKK